jgi:hypothetical protein
MTANNGIAKSLKLDLEPIKNTIATAANPVDENDFDEVRASLRDVIHNVTTGPLADVLDLASQSQSDKHYKNVAELYKIVIDANKTLMELNQRRFDITGQAPVRSAPRDADVMFVGTTADLLKMIRNAERQEKLDACTIDGVLSPDPEPEESRS